MRQVRAGSIGPMIKNLSLFFAVISAVVLAMIAGQFPSSERPYVPALSSKFYYEKGNTIIQGLSDRLGGQALKVILKTELPVMAIADEDTKPYNASDLMKMSLNLLAGVKLEDPLTYLKAQVPMMDFTPVTADNYDETMIDEPAVQPGTAASGKQEVNDTVDNKVKSAEPLIALYSTHTSETYELTDGLAHLKGKAGGVSTVAQEIQKVIEENYGIAAAFAPTIHDKAFNRSYTESEKTVKQLLKDNPNLEMIFDIHRDGSLTREQSLVKIGGQEVAKILIVVGTDARADHPKWRENLDLAKKIAAKMDYMYPGLSRGIAIQQGRYNQHLSNRALLVEIGTAKNSTEEAVASARLFANVVVAVLNDMKVG